MIKVNKYTRWTKTTNQNQKEYLTECQSLHILHPPPLPHIYSHLLKLHIFEMIQNQWTTKLRW